MGYWIECWEAVDKLVQKGGDKDSAGIKIFPYFKFHYF